MEQPFKIHPSFPTLRSNSFPPPHHPLSATGPREFPRARGSPLSVSSDTVIRSVGTESVPLSEPHAPSFHWPSPFTPLSPSPPAIPLHFLRRHSFSALHFIPALREVASNLRRRRHQSSNPGAPLAQILSLHPQNAVHRSLLTPPRESDAGGPPMGATRHARSHTLTHTHTRAWLGSLRSSPSSSAAAATHPTPPPPQPGSPISVQQSNAVSPAPCRAHHPNPQSLSPRR